MMGEGAAAAAIKAALDLSSTPEARQSANVFLESMKSGDVRVLAATAFELCKQGHQLEIRHYGLKMLQHLVRVRWDELDEQEKLKMRDMVMEMINQIAKPNEEWSLRSQTAALAAEVARREGPDVWKIPLLNLSTISPVHAEMVVLVLRWLPEDVIVHNEDLENARRKTLLLQLTEALSELMPFMFKMLETHYGSGMEAAQRGQLELAKQHGAVVSGTLKALMAYADWAPVIDFSTYGLIEACGILLSSNDFRLSACQVLKQLVTRKRPSEAPEALSPTIGRIFDILLPVCEAYFQHLQAGGSDDINLAECLCLAFLGIGIQYLEILASDQQKLLLYLKLVLTFFQHPEFSVHIHMLPLWPYLFRSPVVLNMNTEETATILLDVAMQKLLREDLEDEFSSTGEYSSYRSRLIELFRSIAEVHPISGLTKASQRVSFLLETPLKPEDSSSVEKSCSMLESVVSGVVPSPAFSQEPELSSLMEGLVQRVLSAQCSGIEHVELHARIFDALSHYLKLVPNSVPAILQKLFQLLALVPLASKEGAKARNQVCTSFLRLAIGLGRDFLPHLQLMAESMTRLQQERLLSHGEQVTLGEALLVPSVGTPQQAQVLEWVMGPFREHWQAGEWQQKYLSSPGAFIQLLGEVVDDGDRLSGSSRGMWFIYHSISLFEKALKRCTSRPDDSQVIASHVPWIVPPLLQFLRCLHSLWSPPVFSTLPPLVRQAMQLSVIEQAQILAETPSRTVDSKEDELRNWLKGVRDSGYSILGWSTKTKDYFSNMAALAGPLTTSLTENLGPMEFRHLRQLSHLVIAPHLKACPAPQKPTWFNLLPPFLLHLNASLPLAWESLVRTGTAKTLSAFAPAPELKQEVIEERILRDLTREVCSLLNRVATIEHHLPCITPTEPAPTQVANLSHLLAHHPDAAVAAIQLGIRLLEVPDSDAVLRSALFCAGVVSAVASVDPGQGNGLRELVAREMLSAVVRSLMIESNAPGHVNLLHTSRQLFIQMLDHTKPVLLSFPGMTEQRVESFREALQQAPTQRDQRIAIKSFLLAAGGQELRALKHHRSSNVVTNVSRGSLKRDRQQQHRGVEGSESMLGFVGAELSQGTL